MDPTICIALAIPVAFLLGIAAGRASLSRQLAAARTALARGVHLAATEHTREAAAFFPRPTAKPIRWEQVRDRADAEHAALLRRMLDMRWEQVKELDAATHKDEGEHLAATEHARSARALFLPVRARAALHRLVDASDWRWPQDAEDNANLRELVRLGLAAADPTGRFMATSGGILAATRDRNR